MKRIKHNEIDWNKLDQLLDLEINAEHELPVRREAIPLIFVPGIMGSRLRLKGTDGRGNGIDGLPNLRWDAGINLWTYNFSKTSPRHRKNMLVGQAFDPNFLEVDNSDPVGNGIHGILKDDYHRFLNFLEAYDWGALSKVFVFPVYAFGYNWTDDSWENGKKLTKRIQEIINEAREITGLCEKVILITHSMGGLS